MAPRTDKNYYGKDAIPRLLVFGYPLESPPVGGLLWLKRVSDSIRKTGAIDIRNISSERSIDAKLNTQKIVSNVVPCLMMDFYDAVHGFLTLPQVALLDSWGEANIILWRLLRLFRPHTRIAIIFHHYEPRISPDSMSKLKSRFTISFAKRYNAIIEKLTYKMIEDSDMILTVSRTSAKELCTKYGLMGVEDSKKEKIRKHNRPSGRSKIRIVGTGADKLVISSYAQKDIDFFCIGRIEKLEGIEKIWSAIKKLRPNVNFVMIGRASQDEINHFRSIGINHKGEVPHQEKLNLYSRSKVFLFPSNREGYGIALAESLLLGMSAIIWKLPVFEELYSESVMAKEGQIRFIERENYNLFASEALEALELYDKRKIMIATQESSLTSSSSSSSQVSSESKKVAASSATISVLKIAEKKPEEQVREVLQSWEDVGRNVVRALSELL